jgi:hypothetical protein
MIYIDYLHGDIRANPLAPTVLYHDWDFLRWSRLKIALKQSSASLGVSSYWSIYRRSDFINYFNDRAYNSNLP